MKLDVSRVYDGQGPISNGIHDAIVMPQEPNLYRTGLVNRTLWKIGRKLGQLFFVKKVVKVK